MFFEVFGKSVSVHIVDTITNDAKECTFEIDDLFTENDIPQGEKM